MDAVTIVNPAPKKRTAVIATAIFLTMSIIPPSPSATNCADDPTFMMASFTWEFSINKEVGFKWSDVVVVNPDEDVLERSTIGFKLFATVVNPSTPLVKERQTREETAREKENFMIIIFGAAEREDRNFLSVILRLPSTVCRQQFGSLVVLIDLASILLCLTFNTH